MHDTSEQAITESVVASFDNTPNARLKQIMQSLVRHVHGFVSDVEPTMAEWEYAIGFLTRAGHITDDKRQEFILLSDTLGISMLVDAINHRMPDGATETTVLGPFYVQNPPEFPHGADIAGTAQGTPMFFSGEVTAPDGKAIGGAWVDVWQSDDEGFYDVQKPGQDAELRARFHADVDGKFNFWSIVPTAYPIPADGPVGDMLSATGRHPYRPAHIHFMIGAPGYDTLVTHLFVEGDTYLESDAVFGVKDSLIVKLDEHPAGEAPGGRTEAGPWTSHFHRFGLRPTA